MQALGGCNCANPDITIVYDSNHVGVVTLSGDVESPACIIPEANMAGIWGV
jgi:hypothetical protein